MTEIYNKTIVMGRITADLELRQTPNGVPVTSFTVAVARQFTDKQTGERVTDFLDVVAWRNTAEFVCRYFSKGRPILIEGTIQTRTYTDKNGQNRRAWEIVADSAHFADSKQDGQTTPQAAPAPQGNTDDFEEIEDDDILPF